MIGVGVVALLGVAVRARARWGDDDETPPPPNRVRETEPTATPDGASDDAAAARDASAAPRRVRLQLVATGPVYVCLVDARGRAGGRRGDARGRQPARARSAAARSARNFGNDNVQHAREREDVPRGGEPRPGRLRAAARARARGGCRTTRGRTARRERPRRHRRHRHRGAVGDHPRRNGPWLSERLRERASSSRT